MDILTQHKDKIEAMAETLLRDKELTGEQFVKILKAK